MAAAGSTSNAPAQQLQWYTERRNLPPVISRGTSAALIEAILNAGTGLSPDEFNERRDALLLDAASHGLFNGKETNAKKAKIMKTFCEKWDTHVMFARVPPEAQSWRKLALQSIISIAQRNNAAQSETCLASPSSPSRPARPYPSRRPDEGQIYLRFILLSEVEPDLSEVVSELRLSEYLKDEYRNREQKDIRVHELDHTRWLAQQREAFRRHAGDPEYDPKRYETVACLWFVQSPLNAAENGELAVIDSPQSWANAIHRGLSCRQLAIPFLIRPIGTDAGAKLFQNEDYRPEQWRQLSARSGSVASRSQQGKDPYIYVNAYARLRPVPRPKRLAIPVRPASLSPFALGLQVEQQAPSEQPQAPPALDIPDGNQERLDAIASTDLPSTDSASAGARSGAPSPDLSLQNGTSSPNDPASTTSIGRLSPDSGFEGIVEGDKIREINTSARELLTQGQSSHSVENDLACGGGIISSTAAAAAADDDDDDVRDLSASARARKRGRFIVEDEEDDSSSDDADDDDDDNEDALPKPINPETLKNFEALKVPQLHLEHVNPDRFKSSCQLFGHDAQPESVTAKWAVPGFRRGLGLYGYQAMGTEFLLRTLAKFRLAFCFDDMGLGKSAQVLCLLMMRISLLSCHLSVRLFWEGKQHRHHHLKRNNSDGAICPSQGLWPFPCLCIPNSPSRQFQALFVRGPVLIFAHTKISLEQWKAEFEKWVDGASRSFRQVTGFRPRLFIGHESARALGAEMAASDVKMLRCVYKDDDSQEGSYTSLESSLCIIVTMPKSYRKHVAAKFALPISRRLGFRPAIGIRDEFHVDYRLATNQLRIFESLITNCEKFCTLVLSATPYEVNMDPIRNYLSISRHVVRRDGQDPRWLRTRSGDDQASNDERRVFEHAHIESITAGYFRFSRLPANERTIDQQAQADAIVSDWATILKVLAIKRSKKTHWLWNGEMIDPTPPHDVRQVVLDMDQQHLDLGEKAYRREIRDSGKVDAGKIVWNARSSVLGRLSGTFPNAVTLTQESYYRFTEKELRENKWHLDDNTDARNPYHGEKLKLLLKYSPKRDYLRDTWIPMVQEASPQPLDSGSDAVGPCKGLILDGTPAVLHILHKWMLLERIPHVYIPTWLTPRRKNRLLRAFSEDQPINGENPLFLLGGTLVLGTGLDMKRCRYSISMSPNYLKSIDVQAAGRISRASSTMPTSHIELLIDAHLVECQILQRKNNRLDMVNNTLLVELQAEADPKRTKRTRIESIDLTQC